MGKYPNAAAKMQADAASPSVKLSATPTTGGVELGVVDDGLGVSVGVDVVIALEVEANRAGRRLLEVTQASGGLVPVSGLGVGGSGAPKTIVLGIPLFLGPGFGLGWPLPIQIRIKCAVMDSRLSSLDTLLAGGLTTEPPKVLRSL